MGEPATPKSARPPPASSDAMPARVPTAPASAQKSISARSTRRANAPVTSRGEWYGSDMLKQLLGCVAVMASGHRLAAADPLAHTFSIVPRDEARGDIGVAARLVARIQPFAPRRR